MIVSYLRLAVILFVLSMQQACVIPAAVDAMQRYTDYNVVTTEQIDENNFYTLVSIEHSRGRFDPLGGHGSPTVTTSMDYQLWHLHITDETLSASLLDEIKLKSKDEIDNWQYTIENSTLDTLNGQLLNLKESELYDRYIYYRKNLRLNSERSRVYGLVNNKNCSLDLPTNLIDWKSGRQYLSSESGTHFIVADEAESGRQVTIFDVCNSNRKIELNQALEDLTKFAVYPDGKIKWIAGISKDKKLDYGHQITYEVVLFPKQEKLKIGEDKIGLPNHFSAPRNFIFDEKSKRFHWLIFPEYESSEIQLITHDFTTGVTAHRNTQLKPRQKK
jgi:hypothetical protein